MTERQNKQLFSNKRWRKFVYELSPSFYFILFF
nr:MAG TPA: hypothetical protein [Caudoviricetes sp.]